MADGRATHRFAWEARAGMLAKILLSSLKKGSRKGYAIEKLLC